MPQPSLGGDDSKCDRHRTVSETATAAPDATCKVDVAEISVPSLRIVSLPPPSPLPTCLDGQTLPDLTPLFPLPSPPPIPCIAQANVACQCQGRPAVGSLTMPPSAAVGAGRSDGAIAATR